MTNENTTDSARVAKNTALSTAIYKLDESINDLRSLRNAIGFNQPEKEPETTVEQGLDSIALVMEYGSEKINNQSKEISLLTEHIRELLF